MPIIGSTNQKWEFEWFVCYLPLPHSHLVSCVCVCVPLKETNMHEKRVHFSTEYAECVLLMIASMPHLPSYMTNILAFDARHSHMDIYSNFEFIEQVNFPNITLTSLCGCVLRRQYFFGGAIAEKSCVYI